MNVLIYSGPETIQASLNHSLTSLKTLLLPQYAIQSVTQHVLTTQPWQKSCALLVLPRTRGSFVSVASKHIENFVEAGGSCLILGSSRATISSRSIRGNLGLGSGSLSWGETVELEEATALPLQLFDKPNNRYIHIGGDDTAEEAVPRHVSLRSSDGVYVKGVYDFVAPATDQFNGIHPNQGTSIVARYASDKDEEEQGRVACLSLNVSGGRLVLWIPNIEYPLGESTCFLSSQSAIMHLHQK
jgi:biotin--protein ligase